MEIRLIANVIKTEKCQPYLQIPDNRTAKYLQTYRTPLKELEQMLTPILGYTEKNTAYAKIKPEQAANKIRHVAEKVEKTSNV